MRRRDFIAMLGGTAAWPLAARAQQSPALPEFGLLFPGPAQAAEARGKTLWQGLADSGYVEGRNLTLVWRAADNDQDKIAQLATELAHRQLRVLVAVGPPAVRAARSATTTIPIVAVDLETDPVSAGLVTSLARPGGNVTGLFFDFPDFSGKWIQLLAEAVPGLSRIAVLWDPTTGPVQVKAAEAAAAVQGLQIQIIPVHSPVEFDDAFARAASEHVQGVVVLSSPLFSAILGAKQVAQAALAHRLPAISLFPEFAQGGGLMGYGPSVTDLYLQAGALVGRILHGEKASDLPVERPTHFHLTINLKTAAAIGVTFPTTLLARADEVIE